MDNKKALIVIDYTNDFVARDGALTCGEPAQKIEHAILNYCNIFCENKDYMVFAIDKHIEKDTYHPENKLFPFHNIDGTSGRELYGALQQFFIQHRENIYWMDKRRYSAFAGTDLDIRLREQQIHEIHLCGVCTDICVLHTAIDAYNLGYKIVVYQNAVASFNQEGHQVALNHFKNVLGATVI